MRQAKESEREMKRLLDSQKTEFENAVKRHVNFIDQLIDDKKSLTTRCEQLVHQLKQTDTEYTKKIKQMQETHQVFHLFLKNYSIYQSCV